MKVVCSYCNANMPDKEPYNNDSVTHTICLECFGYFQKQLGGQPLEQYLDNFEAPIMIMDAEARIGAANEKVAELTGKPRREVPGLLGGEAFECCYSRLPGGCGKTIHCETCTVRKIVNDAITNKIPQLKISVKIQREKEVVSLKVSAEKIGQLVQLTIES